jgi:hypothetical protein
MSAPADHERGAWSRLTQHWLSSHRQIIETAFSILVHVFDLQHLKAILALDNIRVSALLPLLMILVSISTVFVVVLICLTLL